MQSPPLLSFPPPHARVLSKQFANQYTDSVSQLRNHAMQSLATKVTLNEAVAAEFRFPKGGKAFFPFFEVSRGAALH